MLAAIGPTVAIVAARSLRIGAVFLPGSYASTNLLGAYLGWPGYSYDAVPSYDDD